MVATAFAGTPTPVTAPQRVNPDPAGEQYGDAVSMAGDGRFLVAYVESISGTVNVRVRPFTADGLPSALATTINGGSDTRDMPRLAAAPSGATILTYRIHAGNDTVAAQRLDASGTPVGGEIVVPADTSSAFKVDANVAIASDGRFLVVWDVSGGIRARFFAADGTPQSVADLDVDSNDRDNAPYVAVNASGQFVVAWVRTADVASGAPGTIMSRRYTADGVAAAPAFAASTAKFPHNYPPAVVGLADDGHFVVVYGDPGSPPAGIYAQRLSSSDAPVGPPVLVAPYGPVSSQRIAMQGDGSFLLAWEDQTSGTVAALRRFSADLTPDGNAAPAASSMSQGYGVSLAADTQGRSAVGWTGFDGGGGASVGSYVRRMDYATATQPTAATTQSTAAVAATTSPPATPSPTTPASRPPAQALLPSFASAVTLPSSKRCASRRKFAIHLRTKGAAIVRAEVKVNGKRVKVLQGKRLTSTVDLTTLPKGRFLVAITLTTADGRTISGTRRYRTCTVRRAGGKPHV